MWIWLRPEYHEVWERTVTDIAVVVTEWDAGNSLTGGWINTKSQKTVDIYLPAGEYRGTFRILCHDKDSAASLSYSASVRIDNQLWQCQPPTPGWHCPFLLSVHQNRFCFVRVTDGNIIWRIPADIWRCRIWWIRLIWYRGCISDEKIRKIILYITDSAGISLLLTGRQLLLCNLLLPRRFPAFSFLPHYGAVFYTWCRKNSKFFNTLKSAECWIFHAE